MQLQNFQTFVALPCAYNYYETPGFIFHKQSQIKLAHMYDMHAHRNYEKFKSLAFYNHYYRSKLRILSIGVDHSRIMWSSCVRCKLVLISNPNLMPAGECSAYMHSHSHTID